MSSIRLKHASGNSMSLAAPGTNPASNLELKLPHTIGSANQLLKVDGSGQLGWATDSTTDSTKLPLAGGILTGNVIHNDSVKALFGTDSDLHIFHNGTTATIDNNTGNLNFETTANEVHSVQSEFQVKVKSGTEDGLKVITDGAVELYCDSLKRFETTTVGSQTSGESVADSFGQRSKNSNTGSTNNHYWKIGSYTGNGSEGFIATWIGTAGYSSGQQISGSTTVKARVSNGSTLEGFYTGESSGGGLAISDIRWKHEGSQVFSIWAKVGNYGQVTPFVQLFGGTWAAEATNTSSSTAPASSNGFSQYAYKQVGNNLTIQYSETATIFNQNINIASGKGINFHPQGGSDVNLLDDYEEGYWSPVAVDGMTLHLQNSGNVAARRYVKIGKLVTCWFDINWDSGNSSANFRTRFSGLPFSKEATSEGSGGALTVSYFDGSETVMNAHADGSNLLGFYKNGNGLWSYSNSAGDRIAGCFTYVTA